MATSSTDLFRTALEQIAHPDDLGIESYVSPEHEAAYWRGVVRNLQSIAAAALAQENRHER